MERVLEKNQIVYQILCTVFRRKVSLIAICTISFSLIVFFTYLKTPAYKAMAKILIRSNPQQQLILFRDLSTPGREIPAVNPANDLIQILTGQETAQQVVEEFQLDERLQKRVEKPQDLRGSIKKSLVVGVTLVPDLIRNLIGLEKEPRNYFADAVEELMKDAEDIELEEKTNVINLSIWEEKPDTAADIANYMAELLIEKSSELEQLNARKAYDFTKEQVQNAEKALDESERALLEFRKRNKIISMEEEKDAKLLELQKVEGELIDAKTAYSEAQAKMDDMNKKIATQRRLLLESPMLANNAVMKELVTSLNRAEVELAAELEKYTESSESVKTLQAKASENKAKIEKELKGILQNDSAILQSVHPDLPNEYAHLTANVAALKARKDALQEEKESLKAEAFFLAEMEAELERLERHKQTNESLFTNLLDKYSQLGVQQVSQMSGYDLKIIDKAFVPEDAHPDQPKWVLVIPLGMMASLFLGIGAVFFIDYWDETFKYPAEVEDRLDLPVLCTVPDMK